MRVTQTWQPQLGLQGIACDSHTRTSTIKIIIHSHLIKYNVIISSHPFSSSQVFLYGPPLNQFWSMDNLPRHTSNTPLYQSQGPLLEGFHLLNHARMTYTSTIKCPASYPAINGRISREPRYSRDSKLLWLAEEICLSFQTRHIYTFLVMCPVHQEG